jgi:predicted lipid-binding transport protein (Tim44 family)
LQGQPQRELQVVTVEIVILAMIAAFLGLRLYSVLGRRAEHEEEPIQGRFDAQGDAAGAPRAAPRPTDRPTALQPAKPRDFPGVPLAIERGLRDIAAADRRFDANAFVEGAKLAYRMILEAFWRGDREELAQLCDKDVYDGFVAAIEAREAAGETLDNRLVRIEEARLESASYDAPIARITVRFVADIAAVTRDAEGNVVAGSLDDAVEARDVWTFSRRLDLQPQRRVRRSRLAARRNRRSLSACEGASGSGWPRLRPCWCSALARGSFPNRAFHHLRNRPTRSTRDLRGARRSPGCG